MAWDEIIKGTNGSDIINGGSGDDFIQGRAGGDFLDGGDGNDEIQGNEGDDYIRGAAGNDFLHGGTGTDTAFYSGSILEYSFSSSGENLYVNHTGGTHYDGNDRLISIERLVFSDAVIDLTQNNAPIAFNDVASTNEDVGTYNGSSVLANDFDWEHQSLTTTPGTFNGVYGTLVLNANGTYTYTPYASTQSLALGQNVQDVFTYSVSDGSLSDTGTLTITIAGRNDAPVANPDAAGAGENQTISVNVLANDTDVDNGAVLTVIAASAPAGKGTASIVGNQVQWNPGTAFDHLAQGATEIVVVSYTISDEHGATSSSTVNITVTGTNDGPVANADTAAGTENQVLTIDALANDTDVDDGAVKTLVAVSAPAGKGSASIVGNQVQFNPGTAFDHLALGATEVVVLNYTMTDEHGATSSSTITVTVTGTNDGPVANPDVASTGENSSVTVNVLANDTDADDGAVLTVTAASAPMGQGSASVVANQVVFNPGTDFDYLDTGESANVVVSYSIVDEHGATSSSTVTITVNGTNDAPVANDDTASTDENSSVSGNVLANDTDPDDPLTVTNPGTYIGAYGTLVLAANGSYTYTPGAAAQALNNGQSANDVFTYIASDGTVSDTATLTITVNGLSGAPNAVDDAASTNEDSSVSGNVLTNDTDPEGDTLTVTNPGSYVGTYGTLTLGANGSYTYAPNAAANGLAAGETAQDVFTYTASDGSQSDSATLTVTVNGTNDAPTITGGDFSGSAEELPDGDPGENSAVHTDSGAITFSDVDVSDTHSASFTPQSAFYLGTFSLDPVDQMGDSVGWDFTVSDAALEGLSEGEVRIQTYTIQVSDGHGGTDSQNVTITITGAGVGVGPQAVWYIDNSAVGSTNVGTEANPFTSIAAFNAAQGNLGGPQPGNTVHLLAGTGTGIYAEADGINLLDGQILVGDATGSVRPTITASAGDGIDVAENNTITGVDIGSTSGAGIDDDGGTVGTLTVIDVGIGGVRTGQIVDIDHGGTLNVTLNEAASTASSGGAIDLNAVGGSFTVTGATTIAGATGGGVDVTSGVNLGVDFQGGLSASSGASTAVNFSGNMGSSSLALAGLDLTTTTGTGLNVSSGGTVTVTGSGNTIATTGGTAVNISFATIGGAGVTLESVSSLGGSATGIILNTAGSGGFDVTGSASIAGSGGTIANKTGADLAGPGQGVGVYINATSNVSLANMAVTGNSNGGVVGTNVVDFTLTDSTLTNNGTSSSEGSVYMTGLTGTSALLGNVIGGSSGDNVHIAQTGGSLDLTIADSADDQAIMGTVNNATGNDSVFVSTTGSASLTLDIDGVDFQGAKGDLLHVLALGNSTQDLTISNNNFENLQAGSVGGGVTLSGGGPGTNLNVDFRVEDNVFTGAVGTALTALYGQQAGMVRGNIEGNTIGVDDGVAGPEGSSGGGSGIFVGLEKAAGAGDASLQVNIADNDIHDIDSGIAGIFLRSQGGDSTDTARVEATVTGNVVDQFGDFAFAALAAQIGGSGGPTDFAQMGLVLSDNTFDLSDADFGGNAVYLEQDSLDSHFYFPGYAGSPDGEFLGGTASADLDTFWTGMANAFTNGGFPNFPGGVDAGGILGATGDAFVFPAWP
jgi:VCBS repeat-containing protein